MAKYRLSKVITFETEAGNKKSAMTNFQTENKTKIIAIEYKNLRYVKGT